MAAAVCKHKLSSEPPEAGLNNRIESCLNLIDMYVYKQLTVGALCIAIGNSILYFHKRYQNWLDFHIYFSISVKKKSYILSLI